MARGKIDETEWKLAFETLPPRFRGRRHRWAELVGATLGAETVLVGVTEAGVLRVMAASEASRRELLARTQHVLAAFNAVAGHLGSRSALTLESWVRADLVVPRAGAPGARTLPPARPESLDQARREVAGVADRPLAERLAAIRARMLEGRGAPVTGDKPDGE